LEKRDWIVKPLIAFERLCIAGGGRSKRAEDTFLFGWYVANMGLSDIFRALHRHVFRVTFDDGSCRYLPRANSFWLDGSSASFGTLEHTRIAAENPAAIQGWKKMGAPIFAVTSLQPVKTGHP
jgi:hypothetical protein